jgi:hypothetical protein
MKIFIKKDRLIVHFIVLILWKKSILFFRIIDVQLHRITLVDVFAPPDHILNSVLGNNNGKVYETINKTIYSNKQTFIIPRFLIERSKL